MSKLKLETHIQNSKHRASIYRIKWCAIKKMFNPNNCKTRYSAVISD